MSKLAVIISYLGMNYSCGSIFIDKKWEINWKKKGGGVRGTIRFPWSRDWKRDLPHARGRGRGLWPSKREKRHATRRFLSCFSPPASLLFSLCSPFYPANDATQTATQNTNTCYWFWFYFGELLQGRASLTSKFDKRDATIIYFIDMSNVLWKV